MAFVSCSGNSGEDSSRERPPSPRPPSPILIPLSFNGLVEEFDSSTASNYSLSGKCDSSLEGSVEVSISGTDIIENTTCNNDNTFTIDLDGSSLTISTITFQAIYGDETVSSNSIFNRAIPARFQSIRSKVDQNCALTTYGNVKCWGGVDIDDEEEAFLGNGEESNSSTPVDVHTSFSDDNPLSDIAAISSGGFHACALTINGNVKCWGYGDRGQLGNRAEDNSSTPVDVHTSPSDDNPLSDIAAISSGNNHTCALTTSDNVKCWGYGDHGQLGNREENNSSTPVDVHISFSDDNPLSGIAAISSGSNHTCALTTNENVKCWGYGGSGVLGNREENNSSTPVDVHTNFSDNAPLGSIAAISAGSAHTCVLTTNRNVKCWGAGGNGRLGNGQTNSNSKSTPVDVHTSLSDDNPLGSIAAISAGDSHTCALTTNGNVKCWGHGSGGKLGNGQSDSTPILTPVDVRTSLSDDNPLGSIAAISTGNSHTCALTTSGGIKCWGRGTLGQLGNGLNNLSLIPVDILLP